MAGRYPGEGYRPGSTDYFNPRTGLSGSGELGSPIEFVGVKDPFGVFQITPEMPGAVIPSNIIASMSVAERQTFMEAAQAIARAAGVPLQALLKELLLQLMTGELKLSDPFSGPGSVHVDTSGYVETCRRDDPDMNPPYGPFDAGGGYLCTGLGGIGVELRFGVRPAHLGYATDVDWFGGTKIPSQGIGLTDTVGPTGGPVKTFNYLKSLRSLVNSLPVPDFVKQNFMRGVNDIETIFNDEFASVDRFKPKPTGPGLSEVPRAPAGAQAPAEPFVQEDHPEVFKPPKRGPKGERQVKLKNPFGRILRFVNPVTEGLDALECFWDSIPKNDAAGKKYPYDPPLHEVKRHHFKDKQGKWHTALPTRKNGQPITHPRPQDMAIDIRNHFMEGSPDSRRKQLGQLLVCLAKNAVVDYAIGQANQKANAAFVKNIGVRPFGLGSGPAL